MPSQPAVVVVLGTGGTISALAESANENLRYRAGAVGVDILASTLSAAPQVAIETEQVAQLDSKDMDFATWRRLAERVSWHLERPEVRGVVVSHGTDTLEETAWFLQRLLAPTKPVVLTGAMRPASSSQADGPGNLAQAVAAATSAGTRAGVVVAFAGALHGARAVRKVHPTRLDAFAGGLDAPHVDAAIGLAALPADTDGWPYVAIATSTAGADARSVDALIAAGADGIVVATTGNGTVHHAVESALLRARRVGVAVLRAGRFGGAGIVEPDSPDDDATALPSAGDLSPQKARVELILRLLADPLRRRRG